MENDLSYEELQRRYVQLAQAMGADINLATHEDCLSVATILNRVKEAIIHTRPEDTGSYFITGESGEKGPDGLPEHILVCPAYGLNGVAVYKKVRDWREGSGT